jgi:transcriptional regulator with XRE-family HTH domain
MTHDERKMIQEYDRDLLRSAFEGVFWSVVEKRRAAGMTFQDIADAAGRDKTTVSKWFNDDQKNWTIETLADIAGALDVELVIRARERKDGTMHTPSGPEDVVRQKLSRQGTPWTETRGNVPRRDVGVYAAKTYSLEAARA